METDRLIASLAADSASPMSMRRAWRIALPLAMVAAAGLFIALAGPRADIAAALGTVRFLFKFVVTIALFGTAFMALLMLARPGAELRPALPWLALAPLLLFVSLILELMAIAPDQIASRWIGTNAMICVTFIPLFGIVPLALFLTVVRHGATTRPVLAGVVAGLAAGGLAATFYAAHCFDDSPLFVATWYTLAIAILAVIGGLSGRFVARW